METVNHSLVIPVYKNQESIPELLQQLEGLSKSLAGDLELVFVVDGSPDRSFELLKNALPKCSFHSQLLLLSRNFGSFPAISAGLEVARGERIAVMAADLQESVELPLAFFKELENGECDIVFGQRVSRDDPFLSKLASHLFWSIYRKFIQSDMIPGGIDLFGCNRAVRDTLLKLKESNTSLVGLLLWIGFRRKVVPYSRMKRPYGKSAWSIKKKIRYLKDSIFAFSDLPLRVIGMIGAFGLLIAVVLTMVVIIAKLSGKIEVPGYTAEIITVTFFGGLNALGLNLIGEYLWRTFENSKGRPRFIVFQVIEVKKS